MALKMLVGFIMLSCFCATCCYGSFWVDKASQTCGTDNKNFYCSVDETCKPRSQRCTKSDVCYDDEEPGCYPTSTPDQ